MLMLVSVLWFINGLVFSFFKAIDMEDRNARYGVISIAAWIAAWPVFLVREAVNGK